MFFRVRLSLTTLCCLFFVAGAQAAPEDKQPDAAPPVPTVNQSAASLPPPAIPDRATRLSGEFRELIRLFQQGQYSELIETTSTTLDKTDKPNPAFSYFRGYAHRRLGQFDDAKKDLQPLGNFAAGPKGWTSASTLVEKLNIILTSRPPLENLVKVDGQVRYHVYFNRDDEFYRTVVADLPANYAAASKFTGIQATEIPLFIFSTTDYPQFDAFYRAVTDSLPRSWFRVLSRHGSIFISQRSGRGSTFADDSPGIGRIVSHETTHILVGRSIGRIKDFPDWFNEGTAQSGEAVYAPRMHAQNDRKMQTIIKSGVILPLAQIIANDDFRDAIDLETDGTVKSDAYAQGFSMTRYLGILMRGRKISDFLASIRQKQSFDAALKDGTGMTSDEFYASWLKAVRGS